MAEKACPADYRRDVFPSPSSTPLTEHRPAKKSRPTAENCTCGRHWMFFYHIITSTCSRFAPPDSLFGPYYAYGCAKEMIKGLLRYGYRPEDLAR
jgi:hypothetical protein